MPATRADALGHTAGSRSRGNDEQGASHGELLDEAAVVVERPVDVGDREDSDARPAGQVDRRRLGGVQHGHRPDRGLWEVDAVRRSQRVPDRQPARRSSSVTCRTRRSLTAAGTPASRVLLPDDPGSHGIVFAADLEVDSWPTTGGAVRAQSQCIDTTPVIP